MGNQEGPDWVPEKLQFVIGFYPAASVPSPLVPMEHKLGVWLGTAVLDNPTHGLDPYDGFVQWNPLMMFFRLYPNPVTFQINNIVLAGNSTGERKSGSIQQVFAMTGFKLYPAVTTPNGGAVGFWQLIKGADEDESEEFDENTVPR